MSSIAWESGHIARSWKPRSRWKPKLPKFEYDWDLLKEILWENSCFEKFERWSRDFGE